MFKIMFFSRIKFIRQQTANNLNYNTRALSLLHKLYCCVLYNIENVKIKKEKLFYTMLYVSSPIDGKLCQNTMKLYDRYLKFMFRVYTVRKKLIII